MTTAYPKPSENFKQSLHRLPIDHYYLMVFHLSQNNLGYLLEWAQTLPLLGVISIPYSENAEVKATLSKYTTVYSPSLEQIPNRIVDITRQNRDKKIILIEIGGYSVLVADKLPNVVLSVEDTTRGHVRFQENEQKLHYPVVSIARTAGKKLEDDAVGKAIAMSTKLTLAQMGRDIADEQIIILGYGGIGRGAARHLSAQCAKVEVYDPDVDTNQRASIDGFNGSDRSQGIARATVIIGCSGYQSVQISDMERFSDEVVLISGSSRQVEFPYSDFQPYLSDKLG